MVIIVAGGLIVLFVAFVLAAVIQTGYYVVLKLLGKPLPPETIRVARSGGRTGIGFIFGGRWR